MDCRKLLPSKRSERGEGDMQMEWEGGGPRYPHNPPAINNNNKEAAR